MPIFIELHHKIVLFHSCSDICYHRLISQSHQARQRFRIIHSIEGVLNQRRKNEKEFTSDGRTAAHETPDRQTAHETPDQKTVHDRTPDLQTAPKNNSSNSEPLIKSEKKSRREYSHDNNMTDISEDGTKDRIFESIDQTMRSTEPRNSNHLAVAKRRK